MCVILYIIIKFYYTILVLYFFRVIDGFDTLDELEKIPVNPKNYKPTTEVRISSITIHANPLAK